MKITGDSGHVWFDLENGYIMKANAEFLVGGNIAVYKETMKYWEPPHVDEIVSQEQIQDIIQEVDKLNKKNQIKVFID